MALNSSDRQSESVLCTSYERGTNKNKNINILIREFLPKGKSMNRKEKKILDYPSAKKYYFDNTTA